MHDVLVDGRLKPVTDNSRNCATAAHHDGASRMANKLLLNVACLTCAVVLRELMTSHPVQVGRGHDLPRGAHQLISQQFATVVAAASLSCLLHFLLHS